MNILIQLTKIVTHHMLTNHTIIIQNTLWGGVIKGYVLGNPFINNLTPNPSGLFTSH